MDNKNCDGAVGRINSNRVSASTNDVTTCYRVRDNWEPGEEKEFPNKRIRTTGENEFSE